MYNFKKKFPDDEYAILNYLDLRRKFQKLKKMKYEEFNRNIESTLKSQPKKFWSINKLKDNSTGIPATMFLNDISASTPEAIAQLYANHFESVYAPINDDPPPKSESETNESLKPNIVTKEDIIYAIKQLDGNKGGSPDRIPANLIKQLNEFIAEPLMKIFNKIVMIL